MCSSERTSPSASADSGPLCRHEHLDLDRQARQLVVDEREQGRFRRPVRAETAIAYFSLRSRWRTSESALLISDDLAHIDRADVMTSRTTAKLSPGTGWEPSTT
ncbi:hypothetical protein SMICM17S_09233 [Streptomyces microflavus]